jgi:prepilin-type N-terminal cleavage/methylation domain-containing protein
LNKKGFSLIEVLVGLVLLAIGLLAIAGMQITSVRGNFFSSNMTQASILAQDRLEILKNVPYADAALTVGNHNDGLIPGSIFTRDYDVSLIAGTTMLNIIVRVRWRDTSDHTISFTTVRSE